MFSYIIKITVTVHERDLRYRWKKPGKFTKFWYKNLFIMDKFIARNKILHLSNYKCLIFYWHVQNTEPQFINKTQDTKQYYEGEDTGCIFN